MTILKTNGVNLKMKMGAGIAMVIVGASAYASQGLVQDRRVDLSQSKVWAAQANARSEIPLFVNEVILEELNRFLGTPEGRENLKNALQRKTQYQVVLEKTVRHYALPMQLTAIPMVESAFQNLPESGIPGHGAGIWMFIASTARLFGMRVDATHDDRLNVEVETDAAMRYLRSGYLEFNDWWLSILAYNIGGRNLQAAIQRYGTRDAWQLTEHPLGQDRNYLARTMAAMIILQNPKAIE